MLLNRHIYHSAHHIPPSQSPVTNLPVQFGFLRVQYQCCGLFCVDFQQVSLMIAHMTDVITKCITIATSVEVAMVILLLS